MKVNTNECPDAGNVLFYSQVGKKLALIHTANEASELAKKEANGLKPSSPSFQSVGRSGQERSTACISLRLDVVSSSSSSFPLFFFNYVQAKAISIGSPLSFFLPPSPFLLPLSFLPSFCLSSLHFTSLQSACLASVSPGCFADGRLPRPSSSLA